MCTILLLTWLMLVTSCRAHICIYILICTHPNIWHICTNLVGTLSFTGTYNFTLTLFTFDIAQLSSIQASILLYKSCHEVIIHVYMSTTKYLQKRYIFQPILKSTKFEIEQMFLGRLFQHFWYIYAE